MLIIEHLLAYPKKQNAWKTHCTGEQCFLLSLGLLNREWVCNLIRNLKCNSSRISLSGSCVHIFYGTSIKRRVVSHVINDLRWPLWNGCFSTHVINYLVRPLWNECFICEEQEESTITFSCTIQVRLEYIWCLFRMEWVMPGSIVICICMECLSGL